jgi:uncharacterized membrane protein YvlD (DUF360 family)
MAAIFAEFVAVVTTLFTFVSTNLIPADVASINIIHAAIWTPVAISLINQVVRMVKGFWAKRG